MRPLKMAKQLISIYEDLSLKSPYEKDFFITNFDQTWASTALGFGGVGGSALTNERTYIFIPRGELNKAFVYFGSQFAYAVIINDAFIQDMENKCMVDVQKAAQRYG